MGVLHLGQGAKKKNRDQEEQSRGYRQELDLLLPETTPGVKVLAARTQRTPEFRSGLGRYSATTYGLPGFVRFLSWPELAPGLVASASRTILSAVPGISGSRAIAGGQTQDDLLRQRIGNGFQRFAFSVDT
jgi:hypothetical protein